MRALFVLVTLTTLYKYMVTGVHDSYWTHACDVDKMNRILREKFVELYEAPILEDVSMCTSIFMQLNKPPSFISFWFSLHLGNYVTFYLAIFRNNLLKPTYVKLNAMKEIAIEMLIFIRVQGNSFPCTSKSAWFVELHDFFLELTWLGLGSVYSTCWILPTFQNLHFFLWKFRLMLSWRILEVVFLLVFV